jgi:hypothetical protein
MEIKTDELKRTQYVDLLITTLVLGSLWGFSEVVLGGALAAAGLPYKAGVLVGVAMLIMGIAIGAFKKSPMLAMIALVAIACKQLVVPILHVSIMCKANSCLAVMLQGVTLIGVVSLAGHKLDKGYRVKIASGASAALMAASAFYFLGMQVAPCQYLLSFSRPGGFTAFLTHEALVWAVFSGMFFPPGYSLGTHLGDIALVLRTRKPLFYYTISAAFVVCFWTTSAIAIAAGI